MDKFLMSSPSRHDHDHDGLLELNPGPLFADTDADVAINSENSMQNLLAVNFPNFRPHSRTISLDEHINQRAMHQHSSSVASVSQDPPFVVNNNGQPPHPQYGQMPTQQRGLHYVPQLFLPQSQLLNTLASMDSVPQLSSSLSNHSLLDSPSSALKQTPGRHKSQSVSAGSGTPMYQTPLRGSGGANMLPANLASAANAKIKKKGHSRSRSRLSFDANNPHGMNFIKQPLNPFMVSGADELDTPLTTPQQLPVGSERQYLSPSINLKSLAGSGRNIMFSTPFPLRRNDTLESIKIEEQDDDAYKQVQKARSYVNLGSMEKPEMVLKFHDSGPRLTFDDMASSNSTPGAFYSHYSPDGVTSSAAPSSFSVPGTAGTSVNDFSTQFNQELLSDMLYPSEMTDQGPMEHLDFDLLQHHFVSKPDSFLRSFPASNDLAGMFQSMGQLPKAEASRPYQGYFPEQPQNATLAQQQAVSNPAYAAKALTRMPAPSSALLPPMATFTKKTAQAESAADDKKATDKKKKKKEKIHECHLCHIKFNRPEHVKRHLKSHSTEKPFQCFELNCGKRFNRKDNLRAHLKKVHHLADIDSK